jgi:hypothetical protein
MSRHSLENLLRRVVEGDLNAFVSLLSTNPPGAEKLIEADVTFVLTAPAVKRVLLAVQRNTFPQELIRQWGTFMRFGLYGGDRGPRKSLSIDFDASYEAPISDAVCRLSELGDPVDGEISDEVMAKLLQALEGPAPSY